MGLQKPSLISLAALVLFCLHAWNEELVHAASAPAGTCASDLAELTATEAVEKLCSREITAVQYAKALLANVEAYKCINTIAAIDADKVLADAAAVDARAAAGEDVGPLCGLAFAVKDNIDVAGYPTAAGTPALEGMMPPRSSPLVDRLLAAGGVVLAKTRMHELAYGITSISPHYGAVLNPYNNTAHVGGSSGGTAALVAARGAPAGFCSDTGGSCRIPGALTGTVGFRPTTGCWDAGDGIVPMTTTRDTVGVNARSVDDVILFDSLFSDCQADYSPVELRGLRVGMPRQWWEDLDSEVIPVYEAVLKSLEEAGAELIEFDIGHLLQQNAATMGSPPPPPLAEGERPSLASVLGDTSEMFIAFEMPRELGRYLYTHGYNLSLHELVHRIASPQVRAAMIELIEQPLAKWPSPADYERALSTGLPGMRTLWRNYFDFNSIDVMAVPTTPLPARRVDDVEPFTFLNGRYLPAYAAYGRHHMLDTPSAIPGISIPAGLTASGLPIGLQLHARAGDDGLLLAAAIAVEAVMPATPPPPASPACSGCSHVVGLQEVSFLGSGLPLPGEATSYYTLKFEGQCSLAAGSAGMS